MFVKAVREQVRLRLALIGPSGSGKTWTALTIAENLSDRVAVIDTEHGSARKYADRFNFDCAELATFNPTTYISAIHAAAVAGYPVLVIDSLSHAWMGKDGALETVDKIAKRNPGGNSYVAWRDVTPLHNNLVEAMLAYPGHLIVTMRAKTDYVMEEYTTAGGRKATRPVKVGLAPIQRDGVEYEFDLVGDINLEHDLVITKSRCSALSGQIISKPDYQFADKLKGWLSVGNPTNGKAPQVDPETSVDEESEPAIGTTAITTNKEAISNVLDELGVLETKKRQTLAKKALAGRQADDLTPTELQAVLTAIRNEVNSSTRSVT